MKDSSIGIGLLGLGTVGSGVYKLLRENELQISQRTGKRLEIKKRPSLWGYHRMSWQKIFKKF